MSDSKNLFNEAYERLNNAKYLYDGERYNLSVSESYYTMFYGAKALIALKNLNSKTHSGVMNLFSLNYVHDADFNPNTARLYFRAEQKRINADYDVIINYDYKRAKKAIKNVEEFLKECEKFF